MTTMAAAASMTANNNGWMAGRKRRMNDGGRMTAGKRTSARTRNERRRAHGLQTDNSARTLSKNTASRPSSSTSDRVRAPYRALREARARRAVPPAHCRHSPFWHRMHRARAVLPPLLQHPRCTRQLGSVQPGHVGVAIVRIADAAAAAIVIIFSTPCGGHRQHWLGRRVGQAPPGRGQGLAARARVDRVAVPWLLEGATTSTGAATTTLNMNTNVFGATGDVVRGCGRYLLTLLS
ncbi:hypothetical protein BJ912DRAFT_352268 [Pholiota molesta]|nr:hypothetical protein BJ912DRAFT_352268 [Pholiota molesta]